MLADVLFFKFLLSYRYHIVLILTPLTVVPLPFVHFSYCFLNVPPLPKLFLLFLIFMDFMLALSAWKGKRNV